MKKNPYLLLCIPMVLAIVFAFILPYGASFRNAFSATGTPGGIRPLWENAALWRITFFTIKQAFFSVLVSLALGLPGAWLIGSGRSRFSPVLRALTAIPFAMPSILVVLGFVLFFGNSGWVNRLLGFFTGSGEGPLKILYRPEAIVLAHGFYNFPLVIRLVGDGIARARGSYGPAAASLGASPFRTAIKVILPLGMPAIVSAVLLVFLYSFTSFAVVLVLGGGPASTTLAVEIYRYARISLDYHSAGVLALLETAVAVLVFLAYLFFMRKSNEVKTETDGRYYGEWKQTSGARVFKIGYALIAAFFILGPIVSIVLESFLFRSSRSSLQILSLRWWRGIGSSASNLIPALIRSLVLALLSSTLSCVLAVLAAASVKITEQQGQGKGRSAALALIRFLAASPLISSGIVLGLGFLIVYGRDLSRTITALVILHAVIALPFAFNSVSEGFRSLPDNILNAASVFGAGRWRVLTRVMLPLSVRRIASAWGFAVSLSLGELNAVMMLGTENWETLPLYIYRAVGAYRYGEACAAGTLLIVCIGLGFLLTDAAAGRSKNEAVIEPLTGKQRNKDLYKPD